MNPRYRYSLLFSIVVLVLLVPFTAFAQDIRPQVAIPGGIQQGQWYEQWERPGTVYCANDRQRYITSSSEAFTLSAPFTEDTLSVAYNASRTNVNLARTSVGTYVYTGQNTRWVQLLEVTRVSPIQMSVNSTFYAKDGSCTLVNRAIWSFAGVQQQPTPQPTRPQPTPVYACYVQTTGGTVNRRSGPGLNYTVVGRLQAGVTAGVLGAGYDSQGNRWWKLADNSWISSLYTIARGSCPN
jgi:hypothetical protein